jgi:tetratricopeptide (TPR) repeat protein
MVGLAAVAAAAAAIGITVILGGDDQRDGARKGTPPLILDLGVRTDPEARELRRAELLYNAKRRREAAAIFARYQSPPAEIGAAFAAWPKGSLTRLEALAAARPRDALVLLHLGFARFWAGDDQDAVAAWRETARAQPDSPSAGRAEDLLYPRFPRGRPFFVPSFGSPQELEGLSPPRQLAALARRAQSEDVHAKLLYGLALQRIGRPMSARRQYDEAARLAPTDAEAQVAAAVGRFDKARPAAAFSRLGPLTRRFPRAQTVRFHLGLLLLWLARVQPGAVEEGKAQFRRARSMGPRTPLGKEASRLLERLKAVQMG